VPLPVELLERRRLLSVSAPKIPNWIEQGPGIVTNGQTVGIANNPVTGAVHTLAAHPTNQNILFAGGVLGGVWRTTNAAAASPNWTPLTDQFSSLAIGALDLNPANPNVLLAGVGGFASGNFDALGAPRGDTIGALYTTDALSANPTFRLLNNNIAGQQVRAVAARNNYLLVAGSNGVYRSTDNGDNFTLLSGTGNLPAGGVLDMFADPGNTDRYYAAGTFGVFRTDNAGAANPIWTNVSNAAQGITGTTINIRIGVHNDATTNVVYIGTINAAGNIAAVAFSLDQGVNWTGLDVPAVHPGNQGRNHFALAADPADARFVYIGGDRQNGPFPNGIGATNFTGNLVRINRTAAAGSQVTAITDNFAGGTSGPHADSRRIVFGPGADNVPGNGDDVMIEADDGGIYRRATPTNNTGAWTSAFGDLRVGQPWSVALDTVNNIAFAGFQDTGVAQQTAAGSVNWDTPFSFDGVNRLQGDGFFQAVDNTSTANSSIRYSLNNAFNFFTRRTFNNANAATGVNRVNLAAAATPGTALSGLTAADAALTAALIPFVLNTIDPRLMLLGATALYEDHNKAGNAGDLVANITPAGMTGFARSLVYGGRRLGTNFTQIAWVGTTNGQLFVRGETGGFNQVFPGGAGQISDIAVDPDDWMTAYVLQGNSVFMTSDGGGTFTQVGGAAPAADNLSSLSSELRSLALWDPAAGTTSGDEIPLVGGRGGTYRLLPGQPAGEQWSEYGANLPNSTVNDIQLYGNRLLVGSFGRGLWSIGDVSSTLGVLGVVQVNGDTDFAGQDDTIILRIDPNNPALLDVVLNGAVTTYPIAAVQQINVNGLGGNDQLIVDSSSGLVSVAKGIRFDGGTQSDSLTLQQTNGPTVVDNTYSVGPDIGQGTSKIRVGAAIQEVTFDNLEPVFDLVPAPFLNVTATAEANAISYTSGAGANGKVLIDNYESIEFANKGRVIVDASFGDDTVNLGNHSIPAGLTRFDVLGGDGRDVVQASVGGAILQFVVDAGSGDDVVDLSPIGASTTVIGGAGNDRLTSGAGDDQMTGNDGQDVLFAGAGANTVNGGAGADTYLVSGTEAADSIGINHTGSTLTTDVNAAVGTTAISFVENVRVEAGNGSDEITIHPRAAGELNYTVLGGDPVGAPGDKLTVDSALAVAYTAGPESDSGSLLVATATPTDISFDEIEAISITGGGPLVINGTNGPDAITLIARDAATHAAADGVRDFTVSVNASPAFLFVDVPAVQINALAGSDEIDLSVVAPNNADWATNVAADGGPPAASDRVVVETPGALAAESAVYAPSASDAGSLVVKESAAGAATNITLAGIEQLVYDGKADGDALRVLGTAGDDTVTHTPGATNDAGSVAVNSLLALAYQNLAGGTLRVDADGGGNDTLVYLGTTAGDAFAVNAAGDVALNARLPVAVDNIETLTLQGLLGDDTFTLAPAIADSVYTTMNFLGGESSAGDVANLVGTANPDDFVVSGTSITHGGKTVNCGGVETENLDAGGGTDALHYDGVAGVTEPINVAASPTIGSGRIFVTGLMNLVFASADHVDVDGNAADTDTLNFIGTNNIDVFDIHAEALGTAASPVLKVAPTAAGAALLTLTNYTGIQTLKVSALEGEDVINVYTAAAIGRNLLIDGGAPTGKKKLTDQLNIFYTPQRPRIVQSATTQSPQSGLVSLDYGTSKTLVQYADIEDFVIRRLT
jgi:hypothetical protein